MGASSDHLSPLIRWLNDNRWIEIEETGMDRLIDSISLWTVSIPIDSSGPMYPGIKRLVIFYNKNLGFDLLYKQILHHLSG